MGRQENDENYANIKVKIELESDVNDRMPSYSGNEYNETVNLKRDIYLKEEQPNRSYIESSIMEFEEETVAFIKPERNVHVESDSKEQEEDIEKLKQVKVLLTKFDKFTCVVCDRHLDRRAPMGTCKHYNEVVLFCKDCVKPNGKNFMCVKCSYVLRSRFDLIEHVDVVHRKLNKFKCKECDSAFKQRASLNVHVQSIHRKLKHACQQCKKVFSNRNYLRAHENFAHRQKNIFTCDLCGNEFRNRTVFKRHIDSVHRKMKEFECKECKRAFFHKHYLIKHVNSVHRKLKPFVCDKCSRSFSRPEYLKNHINSVHLKIKYTCSECNKELTQKIALINHINVVHLNIRPFVCTICKHEFGWKSDLKKHMTLAKCQLKNIKQSVNNRRR